MKNKDRAGFPLWLRLFDSGLTSIHKLSAATSAIYQGFWLGFLDHNALNLASHYHYRKWSTYHQNDYNQSGLWDWERSAYQKYFAHCDSILVGAAGGGREVIALSRRGVKAKGFECTGALVSAAKQLIERAHLETEVLLAEPNGVPCSLGRFDGLIMGWGGYMHIPGRLKRIEFLRHMRDHAADGAPLLLSFFTRRGTPRKFNWIYSIASLLQRVRQNSIDVEMGDSLDNTFDHYFTENEIREELEAAGFKLIQYAEAPYGHAIAMAAERVED